MNEETLYKLTHGIYILGANDNGREVGSTIDAVMQVANKPLVIAVSCHNQSYTKKCIEKDKRFSLSVVGQKVDPFIIANFGFQSSRDINKWDKVAHLTKDSLPYLDNCIARLTCNVLNKQVFESNTLFWAEVTDGYPVFEDIPLTYADYRNSFKNEVLKYLPTILNSKEKKMADNEKQWVCVVCGYAYDGDIPFEELPDDWVCPVCGVDKSFFEQR